MNARLGFNQGSSCRKPVPIPNASATHFSTIARDELHREIGRLREENEELRERLRQAEEAFAPLKPFPPSWRLTKTESRILTVLMRLSPNGATKAALHYAGAATIETETDPKVVDVHMVRIRRKLTQHCPGATVDTLWGEGFRISARARDLIGQALDCGSKPAQTPVPNQLPLADVLTIRALRAAGNNFADILRRLPGRTAEDVKAVLGAQT